jgi:hypothetical protein
VANSSVAYVAEAADTSRVTFVGLGTNGAQLTETVQLNGTTSVPGVGNFSRMDFLAIGELPAARTLTVSGNSVNASFAGLETLQKQADKYNATAGYTFTVLTGSTGFLMENLDIASATNVKSPAEPSFYANLWTIIETLNQQSDLVTAERAETKTLNYDTQTGNFTVGLTVTGGTSGATGVIVSDLDTGAAGTLTLTSVTGTFENNEAITDTVTGAALVDGTLATSPGTGAPDNTTGDVFLAGGHEGSITPGLEGVPTASFSDWQAGLDLLTKVRVNTVQAVTSDPAVHAAVLAHDQYMGGVGRSERDSVVGVQNSGRTEPATKAEVKSQIIDLNSKHIRVWAQNVERFNTSGEREVMEPQFGACIVAGMQAGSPVGTPLTHKFMNTLSLANDSSWNAIDDAEEMIQAGLCFAEVVDGVGRRIVRNVTTHLTSSNIAFTEASVNEAVNFSVFNFRTTMERMVGQAGFAGTVQAANGLAINQLGLLVGVSLVAYRSLSISLILDVLEVSVEMAPVLPINFVKTTVHLVSIPQSAAAA